MHHMGTCQPRKSSWRRGCLNEDVQDVHSGPRAGRASEAQGSVCGSALAQDVATGTPGTSPRWGQAGGQAGLSPELILGDQAGLGEGSSPSSGCHVCRPQVPIIPVVYSSFSSFYNYKTKLFTSGTPTCALAGPPVLGHCDTRAPKRTVPVSGWSLQTPATQ